MKRGTHNKAHVLEMAQELVMGQICFSPSPHSNSKGQRFVWYFDQETAKIHHTHVNISACTVSSYSVNCLAGKSYPLQSSELEPDQKT
jgi:hypothetical protein